MGVEGQRTYPHNSLVEAAYSLGALGLVAYVTFVGSAAAAALSVLRRRPRGDQAAALVLGLGAFAIAKTNISGEIGEDAILWSAAAFAVVLYLESGSADVEVSAPTKPLSSVADERRGRRARRHHVRRDHLGRHPGRADDVLLPAGVVVPVRPARPRGGLPGGAALPQGRSSARSTICSRCSSSSAGSSTSSSSRTTAGSSARSRFEPGDAIVLIHGVHAIKVVEDFQALSREAGAVLRRRGGQGRRRSRA